MAINAIQSVNLFGNARPASFNANRTAPAAQPAFMGEVFSAENKQYNLNHPRHNGVGAVANRLDLDA